MSNPQGEKFLSKEEQLRIQHIDLPPVLKEKRTDIARAQQEEEIIEIPHVEYIERIEEVPSYVTQKKIVHVPRIEVTERLVEIPRHVKEERIVEVPQIQIVDKVVEVPQYITQQRVVEVPKIVLQERIIPIPRRTIEEKVVEVPEDEFQEILSECVQPPGPPPAYGRQVPLPYDQVDDAVYARSDEPIYDEYGNPLLSSDGRQLVRRSRLQVGARPVRDGERLNKFGMWGRRYSEEGVYLGEGVIKPGDITEQSVPEIGGRPVDEVVEIPHVQHIYRNITQPVLRHVPKPVEVPLTHYKPIPVERIVDRHVPIPVELEVIQEFICPKMIAKYVDVPVAIPVTRLIEKPVPADAMANRIIMDAYMSEAPLVINKCTQSCTPVTTGGIPTKKMTEQEAATAGVSGTSRLQTFKSRGRSMQGGINIEKVDNFFTQKRSVVGKIL